MTTTIDISQLQGKDLLSALRKTAKGEAKILKTKPSRQRKSTKDRNAKRKALNKEFFDADRRNRFKPYDTTKMTEGEWTATTLVYRGVYWTCRCGCTGFAPAAKSVFLRLRHKRYTTLVREVPAEALSDDTARLPRVKAFTQSTCTTCNNCMEDVPYDTEQDVQLDFGFEYPKHIKTTPVSIPKNLPLGTLPLI